MPFSYLAEIGQFTNDAYQNEVSKFAYDGASLLFAYSQSIAFNDGRSDAANSFEHIFYRTMNPQTGALTAPVDVSGPDTQGKGFSKPDLVRTNAGILIGGYSRGRFSDSFFGFEIQESTDGGLTWGSKYAPAANAHDILVGIATDGTVVRALSQSDAGSGYIVTLHTRTGVGTWSARVIFAGSSTNNWFFGELPCNNFLILGNKVAIAGYRVSDPALNTVSVMQSDDGITFVERVIWTETLTPATNWRHTAQMVKGSDGILRLLFRVDDLSAFTPRPTAHVAYSRDFGHTWTIQGEPAPFNGVDSVPETISWPDTFQDLVGFCLDPTNQWFVTVPQMTPGTPTNLHTFKATSEDITTWSLVSTDGPFTHAGLTFSTVSSIWPCPMAFVDGDCFRVVAPWDSVANRSHLWVLRFTGLGSGLSPGGGGKGPKQFPVDG